MPTCEHCGAPAIYLNHDGGTFFACLDHVITKVPPGPKRSSISGDWDRATRMVIQDELRSQDRFGRSCSYIDTYIEDRIGQLRQRMDALEAKRKRVEDAQKQRESEASWMEAPSKAAKHTAVIISVVMVLAAIAVVLGA